MLTHQCPQPANDLAGPLSLGRDLAHSVDQLLALTYIALKSAAAAVGIVDDGRERLIQLVGHARRHLAHGTQATNMNQLRLMLPRLLLGAAHGCDVPGVDVHVAQLPNRREQQRVDLVSDLRLALPVTPALQCLAHLFHPRGGQHTPLLP